MKAALYLRLSRDDENGRESESIANQKLFLEQYAAEHGFLIEACLADDGWSGLSFDRPGFRELLQLIEAGKIQAVITKDLSRLGRDYIQTGYYLERYFPLHGVRYIAVNDGIDTARSNGGDDLSPLRAVFNDYYAKDISKKVRAALTAKKKNGAFIGSRAPYGYKKHPNDRNRLIPDETAAVVVRRIFNTFTNGETIQDICNGLTADGILTPSAYGGYGTAKAWNAATVRRILSNPVYLGHLCQNKSQKLSYKLAQKRSLPQEEWITVCHTHEAVVPQAVFETAQKLLAHNSYHKQKRGGNSHLLSGFVFCAECGHAMTFLQESEQRCYLVCSSWKRRKSESACQSSHSIREDAVLGMLQEELTRCMRGITPRMLAERCDRETNEEACAKQLNTEERQLQRVNRAMVRLYHDRVSGLISEANFVACLQAFEAERKIYEREKARIATVAAEKVEQQAEQLLSGDAGSMRQLLGVLVKRIEIDADRNVTFFWHCKSPETD